MAASTVRELVSFVRSRSPYYRSLYAHLPEEFGGLESLPVVDNLSYWKASNSEPNGVLTEPLNDAIIMRSGGSTSTPKTVYMTRHEFHLTSQINGVQFAQHCGIVPGDRVANLSSQGGMYSGFMTYGYTVMNCPLPIVNMPISGKEPLENIERDVTEFKATVMISNVFIATRLAEFLKRKGASAPSVRLILFTGEAFYADLRPLYAAAYPNAAIRPLAYASVECKVVAFPDRLPGIEQINEDVDPVYRVCSSAVVMEILAEDGSAIKTTGRRGTIVVTNLLKRLQPTIRYPIGDMAEWVDYEGGLFVLRGRSNVGLKVGTALLDTPLIRRLVIQTLGEGVADSFQTIIRRNKSRNVVIFRIAAKAPPGADVLPGKLEQAIVEATPAWARNRDEGHIAPVQLEWVEFKDLVFLEASGKLKDIVEERY